MKLEKLAGATSEIWQVFVRDSSSTTGAGLTGLTNASSSLTAYYHRDTDTTTTAIALVTMTVGTFTSSGFKEIDATNMPGWYQFCPPNAALASGAKSCAIHLKGATNMAALPIEVQLVAVNPDSATAFITGVNSLAPPTNWNLMTIDASGRVDVGKWIGGTIPAVNVTGVPLVDAKYLLGTVFATPATAGVIDANVKNWKNQTVATPTVSGYPRVDLQYDNGVIQSTAGVDISTYLSYTANAVNYLDAFISSRAAPTDVLAQVQVALATDTYVEPTGAPAATATLANKISFLYEALRNKLTVSATAKTFCNDAGAAQWSKALSDDGTTFTEAEGS